MEVEIGFEKIIHAQVYEQPEQVGHATVAGAFWSGGCINCPGSGKDREQLVFAP